MTAPTTTVLVTSYEALRRVALAQSGPNEEPSLGFTVLLRQGMTAWIQAWAMCPRPAAPESSTVPPAAIPSLIHRELAHVWAHIVLLHREAPWR
jgi:hypothetical protein